MQEINKLFNSFLAPIIIGVISSFIASCVFLFFIRRKRPKLIISNNISRISKDSRKTYVIKIINKSKRPIINIRASLSKVTTRTIEGGDLPIYKKLPLKTSELFELSGYDRNNRTATYTFRFSTTEDLNMIWDDTRSYLRFRVICTDSFSNFSRVFNQFYSNKEHVIKDGEFRYGDSFEII